MKAISCTVAGLLLSLAMPAAADGMLLIAPGGTDHYRATVAAIERAMPEGTARHALAATKGRAFVHALASAVDIQRFVVLIAPTSALALDDGTQRALLTDVAPRALRSGARLHVLAVGADPDPLFLRQLSQVTGGTAASITSAAQITPAIERAIRSTDDDLAREVRGDAFYVPRDSGPVTLLAQLENGQPIEITTPLEQIVGAQTFSPLVEWYQEGDTVLVTFVAPTPGRWRISGKRKSTSVYHGLALELRRQGTSPEATATLTARLRDALGDVDQPLLWELAELKVWLQDATTATPLEVTTAASATPPGNPTMVLEGEPQEDARVIASLDARTFHLTAKYPPDAPAAVNATLVPLDRSLVVARLKVLDTTIVEAGMRVYATLRAGSDRSKVVVAAHDGDRVWTSELPTLDSDLSVSFKVRGQTISGAPFDIETQPVHWTTPLREPIVRDFDANGRMLGDVVEPEIAPLDVLAEQAPAIETAPEVVAAAPSVAAAEAHADDTRAVEAAAAAPSNVPVIAIGAGIALVANVLLLFALIRRSRTQSDGAASTLAAAVDDYKQALDARA